jgi:aminopeptidase N
MDGGLTRTRRLEVDVAGERTLIPELVGEAQPDLVLVNDEDLSYTKIRLDPHSLATLVSSIGSLNDSLPSALCWASAWDMCRDAEMAARDYVQLVLSGISSVADISVVQTLLSQANIALRRYVDPSWRPSGLALMASTLRELALAAPPGSDTQLAYIRVFTWVALSPDNLELVAGLLDGSVVIEGLSIDTEMRWALLTRLVSRGLRGPADIDAELARDATDAGERHAASCRAAIPSAAAKRATWDLLTSGSLTLAEFRSMLGGFVNPDQADLIEPYQPEYFGAIGPIWANWSSAMAQDFVDGLYRICPLTAETVAATDAYIAAEDPPAALRRLLTEGRDDVLRALRCQARDREAGQA